MKLTEKLYNRIKSLLPKQRGNVKFENKTFLEAIIYVLENGCKWRALPKEYGPWHSIYVRFNRWVKNGVFDKIAVEIQKEDLVDAKVLSLDSTSIKVHPDAQGALKTAGEQAIGKSVGGQNTKINALVASDKKVVAFNLSAGNVHDTVGGALLLETVGKLEDPVKLLMDRAYEGDKMRFTAWGLNFIPVVPPKKNRKEKWDYDKELYKLRNLVERFFRRLKEYRRICTRYDKLDIMFAGFVNLGIICINLVV